ncbi:MAG: peptide/nickel transport system substrate-binding protein, partial [Streptomycetaceae bacterium]|nr:peptide/nickel transport system substrate-binding protein [Streptomycetaceae bacterium]
MSRSRAGSYPVALSLVAVAALALSACSGGTSASGSSGGGGKTLVVDTSFNLKTADPGREFETTGMIVDKALYETLLT